MGFFGFFNREKKETLDKGLEKSKESVLSKIGHAIAGKSTIDDDVLDNLEEALITSDVGVETTLRIIERVQERVKKDKYIGTEELNRLLVDEISSLLQENNVADVPDFEAELPTKPYVIMVVGVNGVGKTTTIGKLAYQYKAAGKKVPTFVDDLKALLDENIHKLLMTPPFAMLLVFTITPLVYMMLMAFTNYSKEGEHLVLFDWVGLKNFADLFNSSSTIGRQFWGVLGWTVIWAFFATFLNFFLGTIMAMIIDRPTTRCKALWRTVLSFTIAVPQFVSLMIIRTMFKDDGAVNKLLQTLGMIGAGENLPFWTNATWARVTVIVVNIWVGIPYTVMSVTGILKNIPAEQYEAARIDGANAVQQFVNITLPYMFFVMTPTLITTFTNNINNFNVIYLLSGGGPTYVGDTAGQTDLLVTWLYKLTVDKQQFNVAAVIGIMTFLILAFVSLVTYRNSASYKDEGAFK